MATIYRRNAGIATIEKDCCAPYSSSHEGLIRRSDVVAGGKLLDRFREKIRSMHYAISTETSYRNWILEFLRFHRQGDKWDPLQGQPLSPHGHLGALAESAKLGTGSITIAGEPNQVVFTFNGRARLIVDRRTIAAE